ncbi:MAG TPA: ABC transporter ATP-binding protein, partial [Bacillota bacterium]|nr:ABC transporter ATP-binding protein [Bacillota bacterium]
MAYIPDNPDIYEALTGLQYLDFIGDVFEVPQSKRQMLIEKYAEMFEIKDVLNNPINSYSHGM